MLFVVCLAATFPHDLLAADARSDSATAGTPLRIETGAGKLGWLLALRASTTSGCAARTTTAEPVLAADCDPLLPSLLGLAARHAVSARYRRRALRRDAARNHRPPPGELPDRCDARGCRSRALQGSDALDRRRRPRSRRGRGRRSTAVAAGPLAAAGPIALKIPGSHARGHQDPRHHGPGPALLRRPSDGRRQERPSRDQRSWSPTARRSGFAVEGNVLLREPLREQRAQPRSRRHPRSRRPGRSEDSRSTCCRDRAAKAARVASASSGRSVVPRSVSCVSFARLLQTRRMPAYLVHGVPDSPAVWDPLRSHLARRDVVTPTLPGFGTPLPAGFQATCDEYAAWLIEDIARLGEPVDLVGHDWGALLVMRVASLRPDLVRTLATGGGPLDLEYRWHDTAVDVADAGRRRAAHDDVRRRDRDRRARRRRASARVRDRRVARIDERMKDAILRLYRSAIDVSARWAAGSRRDPLSRRSSSGRSTIPSSSGASAHASPSACTPSCSRSTAATGGPCATRKRSPPP